MFRKRTGKTIGIIMGNRQSDRITLRSRARSSRRLLNNLIDIDANTITAEVFGTLQPGIGRGNTKMRFNHLNITSTATSITLKKFLHLERHTKLVNRGSETGANGITYRTQVNRH